MKTLLSFHSDKKLKTDLIKEIKNHEKADQIMQGTYGKENGKWKGCGVGCSIHSYNIVRNKDIPTDSHMAYETEFGIPRILARLEDRIFEGMSAEDAKGFPYKFMSAIPVGKDLEPVWKKFFIWLLVDEKEGVIQYAKTDQTKKAIVDVADLLGKSLISKVTPEQYKVVREAAWKARNADAAAAYAAAAYAADAADAAAAYAAAAAAAYAADAADAAAAYAADAAAADAAYAAAAAAAYAADAADAAAAYAAAAAAAYAADAADAAARRSKFKKMADKLVELLKAA